MPANVLVFGAGGVGLIYAAILERGGAKVTAVCRANYDAVKANGILMRSALWGHVRTKPTVVKTCEDAREYGPFDYIVVSSKAFLGTPELIKDAVSLGQTAIVLAQNGIAIEEEYTKAFPDNTIISGVVYLPTTQVEPGIVEHGTTLQRFEIGTFPHEAPEEAKAQARRFSDLFAAGDADAPVFDDIQARRWNKVALNATFNPITALTMCDDANFIRSSSYALDLLKYVMREMGTIATAAGYPNVITEEEIDKHMARHVDRLKTGGKEPSMLTDVRHGRPMEVEAIMGNAVRQAEELKVPTPYLKMLYVLAKARNFATLKNGEWKPIAQIN